MKIGYLSKEYPPNGLNFASAIFYPPLAADLSQAGHEVHVICQGDHVSDETGGDGVHVHRVGPAPRSGSPLVRMHYNLSAWRKLRELAGRNGIDVVDAPVTFGEAFLWSLWKRAPLVVQTFAFSDMFLQTGSYGSAAERVSYRVSAWMENISLRRADRIVANSPQTRRYLVEEKGLPADRVSTVWEARIDLERFRFTPSDIRAEMGIPADARLVLYVGWLQARKGTHILSRAIPRVVGQLPGTVFLLLGRDTTSAPDGGSFKEYLLNSARRDGCSANVRIVDSFIPEEKLVQLYSACDVLVLPSLSETFGWPVVEAMACGRPVVATATGIAPELFGTSGAMQVVPPGDSDALAGAMVDLLSLPAKERERLAAGHRRIVKDRFSFPRMVESYASIYESVIEGRGRGG